MLVFICSPPNGHLGCLLVSTITKAAALNILDLPLCQMVALLERREESSTRKKERNDPLALEEGKLTFIGPFSARYCPWKLKYMSSVWTWEIPLGRTT